MAELYSPNILALTTDIRHLGQIEDADGRARKVSRLCGSWVEVDVNMEGTQVSDISIRLQACALGQAATAILSQHVLQADIEEIRNALTDLRKMLKKGGDEPSGRFASLSLLQGVREYPARHASTLLAFEATVAACEQALATGNSSE